MNLRTDMPPEGKPFILFLFREPQPSRTVKCTQFTVIPGGFGKCIDVDVEMSGTPSYYWAGIAQLIIDQGEACFVMAGTGKSEADGIEIEMDRELRWAWAEIDDMSQGAVPWEGRES